MSTAAKSLSPIQREILRLLLPHGADGMRIKDLRGPGPKSPANRAVFSRSVRRLASRGLVIRCNFRHGVQHGPNTGHTRIGPNDNHTRANHLLLTKLGREIANHLLAEEIQHRFPREEAPPPPR